jgi:glycosyltransferase involved in cell wall biosynthesis
MLEISLVLTISNSQERLPRLLDAIAGQSLSQTRMELIAVDDGSTNATQPILESWKERLPLRIVRQNHAGRAAAKSVGVFMAHSPIIMFVGDSAAPGPNMLGDHLSTHLEKHEMVWAVASRVAPSVDVRKVQDIYSFTLAGSYSSLACTGALPGQEVDPLALLGGMNSFKRAMLVRYGVFHPDFGEGYEDVELGWRLHAKGLRVVLGPTAWSDTAQDVSFDQVCARCYVEGHMRYWLMRLHNTPKMRDFCEVEALIEAWSRQRRNYASHLRWTRKLGSLAANRQAIDLPPHPVLQESLDKAYREAFFLARAKGFADAAATAPLKEAARSKQASVIECGLSPGEDARAGRIDRLATIVDKARGAIN